MRHDHRPVMRRDAIEVAVCDGNQFLSRKTLPRRHHTLLRRMERQVVRPEGVGLRLTLRIETVDAGRNAARDMPFPFGDPAVFNPNSDRGHRGFGAFVQHAEESRLTGDRIVVAPIYVAD